MKQIAIAVLGLLALFIVTAPSVAADTDVVVQSNGNIVVDNIQKDIYKDTDLKVDFVNNLDQDVDVTVDSGDVDLSPRDFTVNDGGSKTLTYSFDSSVDEGVVFEVSWNNTTKSVTQSVDVNYLEVKLDVDKKLEYSITKNSYTKDTVYVENDGDCQVDVEVKYNSNYIISVNPDHFTLNKGEEKKLTYIIAGKQGKIDVEFDISHDGYYNHIQKTVKQQVTINTTPSQEQKEYKSKLESYRSKYKSKADVVDNIMLNGSVGLKLSKKWTVGEGSPITVKLDGDPVTAFVRVVCDKTTDGILVKGTDTYTPKEAGKCTFQVMNYNGQIKKEKTVTVSKKTHNLSISNKEINEKFEVTVPQEGNVKVKCIDGPAKGDTVYDENGYRHEISIAQGGKYKIVYDSQKYHGTDTFTVKGKVNLAVFANGKQIRPPGPLPVGEDLVVQAKTSGGKGIDGTVTAMIPAEAMGYSSDYARQYQMWQTIMVATGVVDKDKMGIAPPGMMSQQLSMQGGKAYLPIESGGDKMVTLYFKGNDYVEGASVSYKIATPLFTPITISVIGLVAAFAFTTFAVLYSKDKLPEGLTSKVSGLKNRFGGGPETFDLE